MQIEFSLHDLRHHIVRDVGKRLPHFREFERAVLRQFGNANLGEVLERELPAGLQFLDPVQILENPGDDDLVVPGFSAIFGFLIGVFGGVDDREEHGDGLEERLAPFRRDLRDCLSAGLVEMASEEVGRDVVLHAEQARGVLLGKIEGRVLRDVLEHELLETEAHAGREVRHPGVEKRRGPPLLAVCPFSAVRHQRIVHAGEPVLERVEEPHAVLEIPGALQETAAVVQQAVLLRAGRGQPLNRLDFGLAGDGGEVARGAGELRHLAGEPAQALRDMPGIRASERADHLGVGAVVVDRGLDGEDAPGREGPALAVVLQLHGVLHAAGDVVLPAEHLGDRLHEGLAGGVVGLLQAAEASRPDADPVGGRGFDGAVDDSAQFALGEAGDRLLLACRDRGLGELHELLELCELDVDVAWHGSSPV